MEQIKKQDIEQQQTALKDVVAYALSLAEKAGASAEVGMTKVSGLSVSTRLGEIKI